MTHKKRPKSKYRKDKTWDTCFLLVGTIAIAGMISGGIAKYAHRESKQTAASSNQFYFTSNYLTQNGKTYNLSADTTELQIELHNYADNLRWSDRDISYTYTISKNGSTQTSKDSTITASANEKSSNTIDLTGLSSGTYVVTATSTKPYKETLTGIFIIPENNTDITYTVDDKEGSPYALLTISTENYSGNVTISWPEGIIPDCTQDVFENCNTTWSSETNTYSAGTFTSSFKQYTSHTYRFLKADPSALYTRNTITATKSQ